MFYSSARHKYPLRLCGLSGHLPEMDGAALTTEALLWNAWFIDSARGIPTKKVSSFWKYIYTSVTVSLKLTTFRANKTKKRITNPQRVLLFLFQFHGYGAEMSVLAVMLLLLSSFW